MLSKDELAKLTVKILTQRFKTQDLDNVCWDKFSDYLIQNKLFLPVISKIKELYIPLPSETKSIYDKKLLLQSLLIKESANIAELFAKNNIIAIPIKGYILSKFIYNSATYRDYGDIDLLIRKSDFLKANEHLANYLYKSFEYSKLQLQSELLCMHSIEFVNQNGISLDLHWSYAQSYYLQSAFTEDFISNYSGNLTPASALCTLAIQSAKEGWNTLGTLWDTYNLLLKFPECKELAMQQASKYGIEKLLKITISKAQGIDNFKFIPVSDLKLILLANQTLGKKCQAIFIRFFMPFGEDWKIIRLPDRLFFLYFLLKPVKSFGNLIRKLLRVKN